MLRNTYIHIPGIGSTTERRIWESGIKSWEEYLKNQDAVKIPRTKRRSLLPAVEESIEQLSEGFALVDQDGKIQIGKPFVDGSRITAKVLDHVVERMREEMPDPAALPRKERALALDLPIARQSGRSSTIGIA